MTTINISAIYKLILDSKNENFNDFRDNVYENILTNMDDDFIYECLINDENVMKKDDIELSEENTDTEDIIITEENRNKETLNIVELIQDKPIKLVKFLKYGIELADFTIKISKQYGKLQNIAQNQIKLLKI